MGMCSSVTLEHGVEVGLESMCLGSGMWTSTTDLEQKTPNSFISLNLSCLGLFLPLVVVVFLLYMRAGSLSATSFPFPPMWSCAGEPGVMVWPTQSSLCCWEITPAPNMCQ